VARDSRSAYEAELRKLEPLVRKAFLEAIDDIKSGAKLTSVQEAVARADWQAALELLRMDESIFSRLDRQIENAFYQGGVYQLAHLGGRGAALRVRFQGRHERAERWVRERSGRLIRGIIEDQRIAVQDMIWRGLRDGRNPRQTSLDLIGRVQGNRRVGGIVGLTSPHARAVLALRAELSDPATADGYFSRKVRDKRFDGAVRKATSEGRAVSKREIDRIATRYADRLLKWRGDMIARTETIAALNAGRHEGLEQLIDRGEVSRDAVSVAWSATMDGRTRDLHRNLNGQQIGFGEAFQSQTGARLRYPGDSELGATGEDVIGCRCYLQPRIDWLAGAT